MTVVQVPPPSDAKSYYADEVKIPRCGVLDSPSPHHPWLDALMTNALGRLGLQADGATASLEIRPEHKARGDAGPKAHPSMIPTSSGAHLIYGLLHAYNRASTHRARLLLILEAQRAATSLAFAPDRSLRRDTPEWRERIANDPRSPRECESVYGVSYRTIYRIRKNRRAAA